MASVLVASVGGRHDATGATEWFTPSSGFPSKQVLHAGGCHRPRLSQ